MKRIAGKFISALKQSKSQNSQDAIDPHKAEDFNAEVFYQRMMERDIYLHISEISVAMVGVCLTGVSIMQVGQDIDEVNTYIDDLLAIDSFIFLTSCLLAYWLLRVTIKGNRNVRRVGNIANIIFLIGMIVMAIVCGCIVFQGDYSFSGE